MRIIQEFLQRIDSEHTRRAYETDVRDFLDESFPNGLDESPNTITTATVDRYVQIMESKGLSVATQRRRLSALRRFFDWLREEGAVDQNPARTYSFSPGSGPETVPADGREEGKMLDRQDLNALISAAAEAGEAAVRDRAIIITVLYGALRRAEIASLTVGDIRPLGRHWILDVPSDGDAASGYVKVPETVIEAIDAVQSEYGIASGPLWRSLSNRNRGAPLTPDAIYKIVRRTGRRAGVGLVSVEDVRQSGLSLAVEGGASLRQIQVHGRLRSLAGVERYSEAKGTSGRFTESAVEFLELDT